MITIITFLIFTLIINAILSKTLLKFTENFIVDIHGAIFLWAAFAVMNYEITMVHAFLFGLVAGVLMMFLRQHIRENLNHELNNVDIKQTFTILLDKPYYKKGQIIITGEDHNIRVLKSIDGGWKKKVAMFLNFPMFAYYRYKVINIPRNRILQPCSLYYHITDLSKLKTLYLTNPNLTSMERIKVDIAFQKLVTLKSQLERYGWIDFDIEMNVIHFEEHIDSNCYEFNT